MSYTCEYGSLECSKILVAIITIRTYTLGRIFSKNALYNFLLLSYCTLFFHPLQKSYTFTQIPFPYSTLPYFPFQRFEWGINCLIDEPPSLFTPRYLKSLPLKSPLIVSVLLKAKEKERMAVALIFAAPVELKIDC
jgi:hypothetical protein